MSQSAVADRPYAQSPAPSPHGIGYRPDIDGLRGIAIVAVILYHTDLAMGGFSGVEIFFVLSGYLITSIIHRDIIGGTFSVGSFYERRVRRLFPALFVVMAATSIAAVLMLLPREFEAYGESLVATTLFANNFLHLATAARLGNDTVPLGHSWSLAVEEQFYLIFPLFLVLGVAHFRRWIRPIVAVCTVGSFALFTWVIHEDLPWSLWTPFRAWQILIGVLLALGTAPAIPSGRARETGAWVGLIMIVAAIWNLPILFGGVKIAGFHALFPTLGAALLIATGSSGGSSVNRFLARKELVFVGLISYSLYLWHWPLLVFGTYYRTRLDGVEKAVLIAVSVALATLTWRYIEHPLRTGFKSWSRVRLYSAAGVCMIAFVVCGLAARLGDGMPGRVPPEVLRLAETGQDPTPPCFDQDLREPDVEVCRVGASGAPTFLLWGDLHALALLPVVDSLGKQQGITGIFAGHTGCPPLIGVRRYDTAVLNCERFNERIIAALSGYPDVRRVILAGRWGLYSRGVRFGPEEGPVVRIAAGGTAQNPDALRAGFIRTLDQLRSKGVEATVIEQAPEVGWIVPRVLARSRFIGFPDPRASTRAEYEERHSAVRATFGELAKSHGLRVVPVADVFCPEVACMAVRGDLPLYRDAHMLSPPGAMMLADRLRGAIAP